MFRHNHNSKLYKYTTEEKRHYKLYKKKKVWVVAGVLLFGPVAFVPTYISANEVNQVEVVAEAEPQTDLEQITPTDESASVETTATSAAEITSETNATNAPVNSTSELVETTSDAVQTSETSQVAQTSEALTTTSESILVADENVSENDTKATTSDNGIATTATTEEEYYTGSDVIKIQAVTNGSTLGSITTEQADDGSTVYTYHATSTGTNQTKVGMTVTYTGNKGDTFTMVVTPSNSQLTGFNNYAPTGSPQIEKLADGTIKYTWTIGGSAETSTVKQELPAAGSLFYESNASANDPYPPYQGSSGGDATILATGDYYQIDFLINGLKAPAETSAKIVLEKEFAVTSSNVIDFIDSGNKINGVSQVNPDTNYLYKTTLTKDAATYSLRLKEYYLEIPVPEHFVLDEDETQKMLRTWPTGAYIMYGAVSITQPGGEGTPIVVKNIHTLAGGTTQPEIYFVGHYTSTETSGKSDIPSGWYDLGDGERQYFGKINVDTKEELATPLTGTGFNQNVLAAGSAQTTEYYSVYLRVTNDQQTTSMLVFHRPGYNNNYTDRTSTQTIGQATIKTPISESGDPSAPVLFSVGLNATGAAAFTPTYHIELPTQITSTGITMPLNNVEDDFADYRSYNPAQTGYTVVVTGDDGSTVTQHLQAGENYNPLTGLIDHFGTFSTGAKLAEGVKIAAYDVTPDNEYFANAFQSSANSTGINDIATGMISVLGYLNTTANEAESYVVKIVVNSENRSVPFNLTVVPIASQKLEIQGYNYPASNVGTGTNQTVYQAGDTFTIGVQVLGKRYTPQTGVNLDAGGILTGNANRTDTDLPGHGLNVPYLTVTDPILYFTLPDQTQVTNFKNSNTFYQITKPPATGVPTPKTTQTTNTDGQTVMILDWTGTGFELLPEMLITLNLKVNENAINGFDTARTADTLYEYTETGKTKDLYTAAQLAKLGVSTDGLRAYNPNVNSESNTTWIQVGGDFSNTTLPDSYKTQIKFADGTVADTMILDAASNNAYLRIVAPAVVSPGILLQGTKDNALSAAGANYPTQDYLEVNGEKQGLQTFQFGIVNNTDESITNAISVLNLPQVDTADSNNETAKHEFTLNISGAGSVDSSPVNNVPNDAHTLYYVTQMATLSADGQTVTFADGTTWAKGDLIPASMLTADQVTDWSQIKSLILFVPSMTKESELLYDFSAYSPTSLDNAGKQAVLTQVVGYDGQASLLKNSVTDTYAVYASMTFVDQAGNQINGHPTVTGQATLNQQTGTYDVNYPELVGVPGETLKLGTAETITGYEYVQTTNSSSTFKADGSTLVTRVYQVDQAKLLVGSLQGTLLATATGDPNANTGSNYSDTPTGVTDIVFSVTDDQLAKPGYTYTVTVVDLNGKRLTDSNGQSQYQTLAQALVAQGVFDTTSDKNGATQNFIVNYEGVFQQAVIISGNDPLDLIPKTVTAAQSQAPFYDDGKSGELMFYDDTQTPLISDDTTINGTPGFKRENYRYTVLAPDGRSYTSLAEALAAKLTFDTTDNSGQTDSEVQVYQIIYEEDLQTLRVTIIDDQGTRTEAGAYTPTTLVASQVLGTGLSNTAVTAETKQTLAQLVKNYTDQGYILVSQSATPDNYDNDPSVDQEVVVHLAHGTYEQAGETKDVTQTINYIYASGPNQGNQVATPNIQQLTFTSTQTVDQVTGEILNTVWSPAQNTTSITSPVVAGYANDQAVVAAETFTYDSPDKVITVYYNALEQVLTYTVIDDTTQITLAQNVDLATGLTGMPLASSVSDDYQAMIAAYLAQGYVLVSADQLPATYDNDENVAQNVTVHLKHGQTNQAGANKVVTQTINYLYGNGPKQGQSAADTYTKSYTFTSVDTIDTVTNEVLSTAWSEAQETETVVSPTVSGYVPSQSEVVSQLLTHESFDQTETILYTAGTQSVQIHYVDMYGVSTADSGVEITAQMQTLTGDAGSNYTNTLWDYAANGYELLLAQSEALSGTFDQDPDTAQDYYVYLTHALNQVEGIPVTVTQTINYVYLTGPKAGQTASTPVSASQTFVPTYTVDQVTGQNVGEPSWAPDTAEFSAVVSPTIAGYEADTPEVLAVNVTPTSSDRVITVNYNALEQVLTYTVIDDTTQTTLAENVDLATGLSEMPLASSVATDYQAVIAEYLAQGYDLVSADQLPATYDNNSAVTQNVTIHLKHGQEEQAGADKVVTQTINYVYGNGPKKDQTAAETYTKSYTFTSVDTVDKVTGKVLNTVWSEAQPTEIVLSPTISGYLPSQTEVASQLLTHDSSDQVVTVLYMAGTQSVQVHYLDMYGVATGAQGVDLIARMQTLTGDAGASYTNTLWDYAANGYELISADAGASSGIFDEDSATAQVYYVYLTHTLSQVEGTPVTVSQTINYVYGNGPLAGQTASDPVTASRTFVPTYTVDQVTGQNVGEPTWTPPSAKFELVITPTLAGYTPDLSEVAEEMITPTTPYSVITVTYRANDQRLTYTVIDDTSAKTLVKNIELAIGKTDSALESSVNDNYQALIASYLAQGYVLASADQLPTNFDHDDALDQNVTLHLVHGQTKKAGATKVVTQTIEYLYGNGPLKDQTVADTYTKSYTFTSIDTLDSVTGEILSTVWSDTQTTETVVSPTVDGYLPSQSEVASQILTSESPAQRVTVLYTAGEQLVKIHYIDMYDQANEQELTAQMQTLTGAAGATYTNVLWDYTANGYELVKVDPAALSGEFDEDPATTQDYYVYLTHALAQVVGTPVTVTQTINYLYQTGQLAGQPASETVTTSQTFVPMYTVDQVTKQNVSETVWTPPLAEFSAVVSPTISGYTADRSVVASVNVTPTSQDIVENVYYQAEIQKVTVTISDETTGVIISSGQVVTAGLSASGLSAAANQTYAQIIAYYQQQGYEVVSADPLPNSFDTDSKVDQVVNVKLIHGKKVTTEDKVVTQTINYLYGNGPNVGTSAATSVIKAYTFTATNVLDAVTGERLSTTWSQPQNTAVVVSPTVDGYLASQLEVASQKLTAASPDQTVTILYTAGPQTVNIHYIDMYDATGDGVELSAQKQTLTGDAGTAYQNVLWDYAANGYELLEAQTQTTAGEFDEDPAETQDYYVYLTHALKQIEGTPITVSQTINYVYGSGPNKGQPVGDSKVTTTVFVPTYTIDQVTKQPVGEVSWGPQTVTLGAVNSPIIAGYTADQAVIPAVTITPTSENISQTVYYTADTQRVILQVTDDETGEVLVDGEVLTQGESGSELPPDTSQTYEQLISEYQKRGYQVVSATDLPPNFDTDSNVDQIVTLKLVHAKKVQTGADKVVKQTINYLYGNGPMQNQSAAPSVVQEYRFTSTMVVDAVTDTVLTTTWSEPQSSGVVISPMIQGYLPELAQVDATLITAEMDDLTQVVNYYAGEQTVKIHYIDVDGVMPSPLGYVPSDGHEVAEFLQVLIGQSGTSYQNTLRQVAESGYKLVIAQPEATSGSFDDDPTNVQEYYVYLVHDTVTSVGEPITITDTVNYIYGNGPHVGQPVATPNVTTRTFTPTYTYDKVTGELISVTWSGDGLIEARIVPQIPGYTPDHWVILSTILTPEMTDRIQTVYYLLNDAVISQEIPATVAPVTTQTETKKVTVQETPRQVEQQNTSAKEQPREMLVMAPELPQTGDSEAISLVFIGLGLLSSATLLGAFGKRCKKKTE
ncbi:mucin-binding protein [Ligilactobacillus apodemi]|uniref:mucin-binding protein n=1 Tax=Ligilactobacillus apodemi TaxID=307126 RepID=UPI000704925C|nr:LPXTG cell wall anchor domain-containing protein [Ligilactobacillus apodemi]